MQDIKITDPIPGHVPYPTRDVHVWGAFAFLAIEQGGYRDIEAVDPYTGRRIWVGDALPDNGNAGTTSKEMYAALRKLVDAMEATDFLG